MLENLKRQKCKTRWTRENLIFYTHLNAFISLFLNCLMNNKKEHCFDITSTTYDRMDRSRMEVMNHTWILDNSCTEGWSICSLSIRFFNSLIPASSSFKPSSACSMTCIRKLHCLVWSFNNSSVAGLWSYSFLLAVPITSSILCLVFFILNTATNFHAFSYILEAQKIFFYARMSFKEFFLLTVIPVVSEQQANNHHSRTHVWKEKAGHSSLSRLGWGQNYCQGKRFVPPLFHLENHNFRT